MKNKLKTTLFMGMTLVALTLTGSFMNGFEPLVYAAPGQMEQASVKVVNINKADSAELQTVRGIGPVIAGKILQYRKDHGNFANVDDLVKVPGIGKAKFEKIKTQITV